ncbi:pseudouridine synthase [Bacillus hwajinpoensis]|uniref:Pseudouridine synthase n=1 Tax=Guptibacillus hwajinpoensis TaxID=208199 RepID=A0A845EXT1_9BACL|nr:MULTISPECIES: pseudouridine synthase [Bacillaceae]MCA0990831.1 rRNA pseudouridine synthase [Pseudalkalibacillus hwajinpoensis]MYL63324.1 pseudouridine synthase [Pseudalkalibacillus hwajinpoensis]PFG13672.1 23S rRNA pseudouridine2605 synthase [Bacillus sp. es.036]
MERLQKVIAQAGVTSRRKAETLIEEGRVKVNGKVVTELGTKVSERCKIEVNGIQVEREEPVYFLFYKPTGVISTIDDDKGRKAVTDYFHEIEERIFPVGRLDYDTSGALLLTNDGDFANKLMHPSYHVDKVYVAKVKGLMNKETIQKLERGVQLEDGKTAKARARILSVDKQKEKSIVELTIHEGKNRQVRRMFETLGYPVQKLKRERYGFLELTGMNPGDYRELKPYEVKQLRNQAVTQNSKKR